MKWLSRDNRGNVFFAVAGMLIIAAVAVEARLSTAQALWLASMNVSATAIVAFMICGPFLLGIALLAVLGYWPEIRWYLWRRRHWNGKYLSATHSRHRTIQDGRKEPSKMKLRPGRYGE